MPVIPMEITYPSGHIEIFDVSNTSKISDILSWFTITISDDSFVKINSIYILPARTTLADINWFSPNTKIKIEDRRIIFKGLITKLLDAVTNNDIPNYDILKKAINDIIKEYLDNKIIYSIDISNS
jgi:hypothetical protein